jgi:putative transposase
LEKFREKYNLPSPRASWWDYRRNAAYFITINTRKGLHFFGEVSNEKMVLNDIGEVVEKEWLKIPAIRPDMNVKLGAFVVMPNHFHGILIIGQNEFNISTQSKNTMHSRDAMHCVSTKQCWTTFRMNRVFRGKYLRNFT